MSIEDRAAANYPQLCTTCGHSMSLHTLWFANGAGGASCAGPCELDGCDCVEATE